MIKIEWLEIVIVLSPSTATAIALHAADTSWIAFVQAVPPVQAGMGPIKIEGIRGAQLGQRLSVIARENAYDVQLIGLVPSTDPIPHAEQIKADFDQARLHDDWFQPVSYILIYVENAGQLPMQQLLELVHPGGLDENPVDIEEMAQIIGVSVPTVRRMCKAREIPFLRWGRSYRFRPNEVIASLQQPSG